MINSVVAKRTNGSRLMTRLSGRKKEGREGAKNEGRKNEQKASVSSIGPI